MPHRVDRVNAALNKYITYVQYHGWNKGEAFRASATRTFVAARAAGRWGFDFYGSRKAMRRRYLQLCVQLHPDKKGGDVENFQDMEASYRAFKAEVFGDNDVAEHIGVTMQILRNPNMDTNADVVARNFVAGQTLLRQ